MTKKVVLLLSKGQSSRIIYNAIKAEYNIELVIIEDKPDKLQLIKRRIKKLGVLHVVGQLFFQVFMQKLLKYKATSRLEEIYSQYNLDRREIDKSIVEHVKSVNSDAVVALLQDISPSVVVVNGTRIISEKVLNCTNAVFINTHMGITPKYRGVHGAYWALVNNDLENCGATVHLVDRGIDTGDIIAQETINVTSADNFMTYPFLQLGVILPSLTSAIDKALNNKLVVRRRVDSSSGLWYHPGFYEYIYNRIFKNKVK